MNNKRIEKSIRIANQLVNTTTSNPQHFSFIFKRNKLLVIGQNNMDITNPKAIKFAKLFGAQKPKKFPFIHSEVDAISKLWSKVYIDRSLHLINLRLNRFHLLRNSKPCVDCNLVIKGLGLNLTYFDGTNWSISNVY